MLNELKNIVSKFKINGKITGINRVETGHINESYRIRTDGYLPGYFLQRINHSVFKDVVGLMKNIERVTQHLELKNPNDLTGNGYQILKVILTKEGLNYFCDVNGNFWRLYNYIADTHSFNLVDNPAIAYEGGKAFGRFITDLADLKPDLFIETIPNFHNLEFRLANFNLAMQQNLANRKELAGEEIRFVSQRTKQMLGMIELIKSEKLPLRVTHNDTKFNNVLFDGNDKAVCIVDLDTIMPGTVLYDFGDAIRTGANTALEDERDLARVDINLPIFESYASGFIESTRQILSETEKENLVLSARYMTYIIGLRFLTDYLNGDTYFRVHYPTHNLDRARVQFKLIEAMEKQADKMEEIILNALNSGNE
jgi:hypothetical protein